MERYPSFSLSLSCRPHRPGRPYVLRVPTAASLPRLSLPTLSDMVVEAHEVEPQFLREPAQEIGVETIVRGGGIRRTSRSILGQPGHRSRTTGTSILAEV